MDLTTGATLAGLAALGGNALVMKVLGPTADYLGVELGTFTKKRIENVKKVFENAAKKQSTESNDSGVPPRILKAILDDASYAEDDSLMIDYFGGVLASSKTTSKRDDRGVFFNAIISRLTNYQLRLHYIVYALLRVLCQGREIKYTSRTADRRKLTVAIALPELMRGMEFDSEELKLIGPILGNTVHGLTHEGLIEGPLDSEVREKPPEDFSKFTLGFVPTEIGMDLFLWAHGKGNEPNFFKPELELLFDTKIPLPRGAKLSELDKDHNPEKNG